MITSIAIVNAKGEMVHPAIIPTFRHCHEVVNSEVGKQNCRSWKYDFTRFVMVSGMWKNLKARPQEFMGHRTKCIGEVEEDYMEVPFLHLGHLDLVPDHAGMFQAAREP